MCQEGYLDEEDAHEGCEVNGRVVAAMTTVEVLVKARELLSDPKRWAKGAYAKTAAGLGVNARSPQAVCYCSSGALYHFDDLTDGFPLAWNTLTMVVGGSIPAWNDAPERAHAEILDAFSRAIELARQEAQP